MRCDDGGPNDPGPDYRPLCSLGTDCSDCGPRDLCAPHQTSLQLPSHAVERRPDAAPLAATEILFMIMGSNRYRQRSLRAHRTWCAQPHRLTCLFFSDERDAAGEKANPSGVPIVQVRAAQSPRPKSCCPPGSRSIFCEAHRATTLPAQYRFLPALQHVKASADFAARHFRWVALVDDDSFVFPSHLRWHALRTPAHPPRHPSRHPPRGTLLSAPSSRHPLVSAHLSDCKPPPHPPLCTPSAPLCRLLSRLDDSQPLYLGDFGSTSAAEAVHLRVPRFACGGGGSVLSAEAVQRWTVGHKPHPSPSLRPRPAVPRPRLALAFPFTLSRGLPRSSPCVT